MLLFFVRGIFPIFITVVIVVIVVGIPVMAVVDNIDHQRDTFDMHAMDRHFQICHPTLQPFKVVLVDTKEELGMTERGDGGFGSTGR